MQSLKWSQVNAWRLAQHGLSPRFEPQDILKALRGTCGIQAQVMSAAELALGVRMPGITPQNVQSALWQERTLVKTWAMRATLHLLASQDLPLYTAARSLDEPRNWIGYFEYYGVSKHQMEAYLVAAPEILGSEPMTKEQFAAALLERTGSTELHQLILTSNWGTVLKPLAWRGELCFGPSRGQNVTYVSPRRWLGAALGERQPLEPFAALQEVARRYLRSYGPATLKEFVGWWGMRLTPARKLFKSLEPELEPVDVEGWHALALRETLEPMRNLESQGSVNLLPYFDAYTMGIGRGADIEPLLPKAYQRLVYRLQGWISPVVLVDGYIKGIWEPKAQRKQTVLKFRMFTPPAAATREGIEREAERISLFLNAKTVIEFNEVQ